MPRLVIESTEFFGSRCKQVRNLIGGLAAKAQRLEIRPLKHTLGHIVAVSDAFGANKPPDEWLFRTTADVLHCQYYEIWKSDRTGRHHHLFQNFFHLFSLTKTEQDLLFCLHTEPEEPMRPIENRVKSTPHIHVKVKEDRLGPISKAHLPVCYSTTERALESLSAFDQIFAETLEVIRHEVIDRFANW